MDEATCTNMSCASSYNCFASAYAHFSYASSARLDLSLAAVSFISTWAYVLEEAAEEAAAEAEVEAVAEKEM